MANSFLSRFKGALFSNAETTTDVQDNARMPPEPKSDVTAPKPAPETSDKAEQVEKAPPSPFKARQTANQRSGKTYFKWSRKRSPTSQTMLLDKYKVVYQPIAKNACTSTKRLIAGLGGFVPEKGQGIHVALDGQNTGLQFKDRSHDEVTDALNDPTWMRFAIFRDPLDRLVSAYVEKFVQNRSHPNQWKTTGGVIQAIFEKDEPTPEDFDHGITFREFAEYILAENPNHLNSHWQPQTFYMGNIPFTHMYDVKALTRLEQDLQDHIGETIEIPRVNVSRGKQAERLELPDAPDLLPKDLADAKNVSMQSFLDPDLRARLTEYYAADISIYSLVKATNGPVARYQ